MIEDTHTAHDDYDTPRKEMVSMYFHEYMMFFFPAVCHNIDWNKGFESLDKELRQVAREAKIGRRLADYLVNVWKTDGEETWVLIHIEVQAQQQPEFPHRMYVYDARIYERYQRPVASFAVLADDNSAWKPSGYYRSLWGSKMLFRFPVVKILDYAKQLTL